jgi:hypothetical protein
MIKQIKKMIEIKNWINEINISKYKDKIQRKRQIEMQTTDSNRYDIPSSKPIEMTTRTNIFKGLQKQQI